MQAHQLQQPPRGSLSHISHIFGYRPLLITQQAKSVAGTSLWMLDRIFPDDEACLKHIFDIRFGAGYPCPKCGLRAKWRRRSNRQSFLSSCCRNAEIYPLSDTIFHKTKISLRLWFLLILHFTNSKVGISSTMAQRIIGLQHATVFKMCDNIRIHLATLEQRPKIGGLGKLVHIDEALIRGIISQDCQKNRATVLGICTDEIVLSHIIPDRSSKTLIPIINMSVVRGSILVTDGFASYQCLARLGWQRELVNHSRRVYVNDNGISQAQIETYWRHLKRSLRLTHLRVNRDNLWKYIYSFNFVYNRRNRSNECFWDAISSFPLLSDQAAPRVIEAETSA